MRASNMQVLARCHSACRVHQPTEGTPMAYQLAAGLMQLGAALFLMPWVLVPVTRHGFKGVHRFMGRLCLAGLALLSRVAVILRPFSCAMAPDAVMGTTHALVTTGSQQCQGGLCDRF
jgi:hypothetical protein